MYRKQFELDVETGDIIMIISTIEDRREDVDYWPKRLREPSQIAACFGL
jgi:hypothetical protein